MTQRLSPKQSFIFDLHGVLFKLDKRKVVHELWHAPAKFKIFLACCNPYFLLVATYYWCTMPVLEQFILAMMDKFPLIRPNRAAALRTANALKPIDKTITAIESLKARGHRVFIFSNIGEESLTMICEQFPEIMELADGILGTNPQDQYLAKPSQSAFDKFFKTFEIIPAQSIFIDDKKKNLETAQQRGMRTILFTSPTHLETAIQREL